MIALDFTKEFFLMKASLSSTEKESGRPQIYKQIRQFAQPNIKSATRQLLETFIPYAILWVLMVLSVMRGYSYLITLGLVTIAAGFLVRIFILFHDAGHGSFFASRRANRLLGYVTGILTFTPYEQWRRSHAQHHATVGNLDRRGVGDVWTLTVEEFRAAPVWTRIAYRVYRNPVIMFGIGPGVVFLLGHRFSHKQATRRERNSVWITNLALLGIAILATFTIGLRTYLIIQVPIMLIAGAAGVWLFYVQHQYEGVYWARQEVYEPLRAALEGSSYYRLPKVLQWITGNIGLHHIHHVQPKIPNYNLQACQDQVSAFHAVEPLTLIRSFLTVRLHLWDENLGKLVSFRSLRSA
jgi:omega-6 fatty acid desaturase (delta-12 desaturase)